MSPLPRKPRGHFYKLGYEAGAAAERERIIAWLRARNCHFAADAFERGDHTADAIERLAHLEGNEDG